MVASSLNGNIDSKVFSNIHAQQELDPSLDGVETDLSLARRWVEAIEALRRGEIETVLPAN